MSADARLDLVGLKKALSLLDNAPNSLPNLAKAFDRVTFEKDRVLANRLMSMRLCALRRLKCAVKKKVNGREFWMLAGAVNAIPAILKS